LTKSYRELILEVWVHRCQPVKTGEQNKLPASRADSAKVATTTGSLPVLCLRFSRREFDLFKHQVIHVLGGHHPLAQQLFDACFKRILVIR